ncbi:MAG: metalloregulator ArsR/SmtB family transcription factor [Actinomycetota bacterium]|jgi:ArsR family transcriptional regulator|nr:metalloregulator ArsR/SmtB family transcription factor [Actinomycetota bacterium]
MKKEKFYNLHSDMCKTISNPRRQAIIDAIRDKSLTVTEIVQKTGLPQSNISQHLSLLSAKGIVNRNRNGSNIYYSIANPKIIKAYDLLTEVLREESNSKQDVINDLF